MVWIKIRFQSKFLEWNIHKRVYAKYRKMSIPAFRQLKIRITYKPRRLIVRRAAHIIVSKCFSFRHCVITFILSAAKQIHRIIGHTCVAVFEGWNFCYKCDCEILKLSWEIERISIRHSDSKIRTKVYVWVKSIFFKLITENSKKNLEKT